MKVKRGNFEWENGEHSRVKFVESPDGKWQSVLKENWFDRNAKALHIALAIAQVITLVLMLCNVI